MCFFCNYFWKKKKIETGSNSKVLEYVKIKKIGAERPHSKFMKQPCHLRYLALTVGQ